MTEIKFKSLEEFVKEVKDMDIVEVRILMKDKQNNKEEIGKVGYFISPSTFKVGDINYYWDLNNMSGNWNERDDDGWIVLREGKILGYRILGNSIDLQEKKK